MGQPTLRKICHTGLTPATQTGLETAARGPEGLQLRSGACEVRVEHAKRLAIEYRDLPASAESLDSFKTAVEKRASGDLGLIGADCAFFSLSAAAGHILAVGLGFEALYSPRFGWATFFQAGGGLASPGAGVALEGGLIWNLKNPKEYTGFFVEAAITFGPGILGYFPGMGSVSGSVTPQDILNLVTEGKLRQPCGLKAGVGYGTPGAQVAVMLEWYFLLTGDTRTGADDLDLRVQKKLQQMKVWGVNNVEKKAREGWPKLERELDDGYRKFLQAYRHFLANKYEIKRVVAVKLALEDLAFTRLMLFGKIMDPPYDPEGGRPIGTLPDLTDEISVMEEFMNQ